MRFTLLTEHPHLCTPDSDTVLWRYVDMPKLISLLEYRALWFAGLDTLEDPYEGLPPRGLISEMWRAVEYAPVEKQHEIRDRVKHTSGVLASARELVYVNCWHASAIESMAMWKIYGRLGDGIAIRTTFDRFRNSVTDESVLVYGGMVEYVDFDTYIPPSGTWSGLEWATTKRRSFDYEREFRGLVTTKRVPERGFLVSVDVQTLVEEIYVAPTAPHWFADVVRKVCKIYDETIAVTQSELLREPSDLQPIRSK